MSYNQKPPGASGSGMGGGVPPNGPNNSQQVAKTLAGIQQQMQNLVHGQNTLPQSSQAELNVFLQQQRFQNMFKQQQLLHFQMQQHQQQQQQQHQQQQQQKDRGSGASATSGEPLALTRTPAAAELLNKSFPHHQQQPNGSSTAPNTALNQFQQQLQALPPNLMQQLQALQYQMQQHQQQQQQQHPQTPPTQHLAPQQQQAQASLAHQQQQLHGQAQQLQQQKVLQQFQQSLRYYPGTSGQPSAPQVVGGNKVNVSNPPPAATVGNQIKPPNLPPSTQITPVTTSNVGAAPPTVQSTKNISSSPTATVGATTSGGGGVSCTVNTSGSKQVPTPSISLLPAKPSAASTTPSAAHQQNKFGAGKISPAVSAIPPPFPAHFQKPSLVSAGSVTGNAASVAMATPAKVNTQPDPAPANTTTVAATVSGTGLKSPQTNPVPLTKQAPTAGPPVNTGAIPTTSANNTSASANQIAAQKPAAMISSTTSSSSTVKKTNKSSTADVTDKYDSATVDNVSVKLATTSSEAQVVATNNASVAEVKVSVAATIKKKVDNAEEADVPVETKAKSQCGNSDEIVEKASNQVILTSVDVGDPTPKPDENSSAQTKVSLKDNLVSESLCKTSQTEESKKAEKEENNVSVAAPGKDEAATTTKVVEEPLSVLATLTAEDKTPNLCEINNKKTENTPEKKIKEYSLKKEVISENTDPIKEKAKDTVDKISVTKNDDSGEETSKLAVNEADVIAQLITETDKRQSSKGIENPKDEKAKKSEKVTTKVTSTIAESSTTNNNSAALASKTKTNESDIINSSMDANNSSKRIGRQAKVSKVVETVPEKSEKAPSSTRARKLKSSTTTELNFSPVTPKADSASDRKSSRHRLKTILYQSPLPELAYITKLSASEASNSPKPMSLEDKLIVFYKNEYMAVRNAEGTFYLCQTMQNVYRTSPRISIRWLSEDPSDSSVYIPDFYDHTDIECVLTTVELKRVDKGHLRLPKTEQARIESILKKAIDVEKGLAPRPELTEENPDGLDISLYKDESQIEKKSSGGTTPSSGRKSRRIVNTGGTKSNTSTASSSISKRRRRGASDGNDAASGSDDVVIACKSPAKKRKSITKRKAKSKKSTTTDDEIESFDDSDAEYKPNQKKSAHTSASKSPRAQRSPLARARAASPMTQSSGRTKPVPSKTTSTSSSRGERANKRKAAIDMGATESMPSQGKKATATSSTTPINASKTHNPKTKIQDGGSDMINNDSVKKANAEVTISSTSASSSTANSNSSPSTATVATTVTSTTPSGSVVTSTTSGSTNTNNRPTRSRK